MPLIDTHSVIKEFIAVGISEEQAEVITKTINQSNNSLVTKTDLQLSVLSLESKIDKLRNDSNWIKGMGLVIISLLVKLIFFA